MRRILFAFLLTFLATTISFSQDYFHGIGTGLYAISYQSTWAGSPLPDQGPFATGSDDFSQLLASPGIFYKSTLAFDVTRNTMLAVSAYPFLGFNINANARTGVSEGNSFGFELPILAEYYFGEPDDDMCFYLGAGGAYGYASSLGSISVLGPQVEIGGQYEFNRQLFGARATFTYGLNGGDNNFYDERANAFMIAVYYCFDN